MWGFLGYDNFAVSSYLDFENALANGLTTTVNVRLIKI